MKAKRADARQNREHLVAVARAMARAKELPSFNALAREAGVGVGTVYRHFEDERALASAIVAEQAGGVQTLVHESQATADPGAALEKFFMGSIDLVMEEPLVAQVFASTPEVVHSVQLSAGDFEARETGEGSPRGLVLSDVKDWCAASRLAARSGEQPREAAQRYLRIVLAGLRPETQRERMP